MHHSTFNALLCTHLQARRPWLSREECELLDLQKQMEEEIVEQYKQVGGACPRRKHIGTGSLVACSGRGRLWMLPVKSHAATRVAMPDSPCSCPCPVAPPTAGGAHHRRAALERRHRQVSGRLEQLCSRPFLAMHPCTILLVLALTSPCCACYPGACRMSCPAPCKYLAERRPGPALLPIPFPHDVVLFVTLTNLPCSLPRYLVKWRQVACFTAAPMSQPVPF